MQTKKIKAFVMAAGAGTRLRPLTLALPKPMVPVVNKPVIEHTLENLKKHGITDVVMNLHHCPESIKGHFGDGSRLGLHIDYSFEKKLMGTAGGVKRKEHNFDGTFVVMSGDGLTDIDLSKALAFHHARRSSATMVLKAIDTKFEYGVTLTDRTGRIKQFIEKPRWSDVFANTVNTGIYILEPETLKRIPRDTFYDFGMQVWPSLLARKERIYGYVMEEYWADVGNLTEYRKGVRDALDGKLKIAIPGVRIKKGVWAGKGSVVSEGAVLVPPCVIGDYCFIGKNAIIGSYTTIGDHSTIGEKAVIKNSVLWERVNVRKNVKLDNCIIAHGAEVSEDISVYEGTLLGIEHA